MKAKKEFTEGEQIAFDNLKSKLAKFAKLSKLLKGNTKILDAKNLMLAKLEGIIREELPKTSDKKIKVIRERVLNEILGAV